MQLMVVDAKKDARQLFSDMLHAELNRLDVPARGRPAWLVKELKAKAKLDVTVTSAQKWLGGKQIPRSSHLSIMVTALGLNKQLLMTGEIDPPSEVTDPILREVIALWPHITDKGARDLVLSAARTGAKVIDPKLPMAKRAARRP